MTSNPTNITDILERCRTALSNRGLALVSRKLYLADIRNFLIWIESRSGSPALITIADLRNSSLYLAYLGNLRSRGFAPAMLRRIVASLKQLGNIVAETYAVTNPSENLSFVSGTSPSKSINSAFDNYIKHFLNHLNSLHLSPITIKSYKSDIVRYLSWCTTNAHSTDIGRVLTKKYIQKYTEFLAQTSINAPSSIERKISSLTKFQDWLQSTYPRVIISDNKQSFDLAVFDQTSPDQAPIPQLPQEVFVKKEKTYPIWRLPQLHLNQVLSFSLLAFLIIGMAIYGYRQFSKERVLLTQAYPNSPVTPNRQISFQGRLESSSGTPITSSTNLVFKLFDASSGGTELYTSNTCAITPDSDGVFSTQIGSTCGSAIGANVFTENANVYLEVTVGAETLTPRQQIATVAYALNSETLQGYPISATVSALRNTVVPMNQYGEIVIGEQSPKLKGVAGTFQISAPSVSIITATGTNGNITLAPDGTGQVNLNGNTTTTNFFNVANAQLTTGSLITGTAANNNTGFKLLDLQSGTSPTSKFSVTDSGLTTIGNDLYVSSGVSLYNNAVSDDTIEAAKFCTGDGETNCVTDFSSLSSGASIWTDAGSYIHPTSSEVLGNSASAGSNKIAGLYLADSSPLTFGTDNDISFNFSGTELGVTQGNNDINFDSNTLFVDGSANRVGIGTNAPTATLNVSGGNVSIDRGSSTGGLTRNLSLGGARNGTDATAAELIFRNYDNSGGSAIDYDAAKIQLGIPTGADGGSLYFQTASGTTLNTQMTILSNGNVGIGTTTPTAKLDILGDASASGHIVMRGTGTNYIHALNGSNLGFSTSVGGDAGNTERMTILNNGNIGINTINPTDTLTVKNGTSPTIRIGTGDTDNGVYIGSPDSNEGIISFGTDFAHSGGAVTSWTAKETTAGILRVDNGGLTFYSNSGLTIDNTYSPTEIITINGTGLGIGDTTPDAPLDVVGDVYVSDGLSLYETAVSDGTVEATKFCTGDGETNCVTNFAPLISGSSIWTDAGTYIHPTNSEVLGNAASAGSNKIAGLYLADSSPLTFGTDNDVSFNFSGTELGVTQGNNDINFDSNTLFVDGSANKIGIGISNPGTNLEVLGSAGVGRYNNTRFSQASFNVGDYQQLVFTDNAGATDFAGVMGGADGPGSFGLELSGSNFIKLYTGAAVGSASEAMRINSTGNVGIGTPTPTHKLSVAAASYGDPTFSAYDGYYNYNIGDGSKTSGDERLSIWKNSHIAYFNNYSTASSLSTEYQFQINGSTKMQLNNGGNLGIGTTGPDARIDSLATAGEQLRLTYTDGSVYSGMTLDSSGNLTIDNTGTRTIITDDLQITGDDLYMNTNTAGYLLIADGTNFNPTAVTGDISINGSGVTAIGADKVTESMLKSVNGPTDELCLSYESSVGDFEWQTCGSGGGGSNWRYNLGTISPLNDTVDLLIGGNATSSAKFAVLNVNSGTPTASVSAGTSGAMYMTANGTLATTAKQSLNIGNSTTGNINIGVGAGDLLIGASGTAVDLHFDETANIEATAGEVITMTDIGNITPDANDTYNLGSDSLRWQDLYLGPDTLHIGTSTSDEYTIAYNTTTNVLGFNVNGSGNPEVNFDSSGNVGIGDITPDHRLDVAGNIGLDASGYVNFGDTDGTTGYGFRDNAGTIEFKNSGGSWTGIGSGGGSNWRFNLGTISPNNATLDLLVGGNATSSAKFAVINVNSGTPTASVSAGTAGATFLTADGFLSTSARQSLTLGNSATYNTTGNILLNPNGVGFVGIGTTTPRTRLHLEGKTTGKALAIFDETGDQDIFAASASGVTRFRVATDGFVYSHRYADIANTTYYLDPAATGTSLIVAGDLVSDGAFSITSNGTGGDITIDAGAGDVTIGGSGKLNAATVDPPYTINGEKYATYMAGMTGVKEETTGRITTSEYVVGVGYRAIIDFTDLEPASDLWLFTKVTNLRDNLGSLVVLLSGNNDSKVWYQLDENSGKLAIYSSIPTSVSYRLTAPRFDSSEWANTRDSAPTGFVLNDPDDWQGTKLAASPNLNLDNYRITAANNPNRKYDLVSAAGNIVEEIVTSSQAFIADLRAGSVETQELVSPVIHTESIVANTSVTISRENQTSEPLLQVEGGIEAENISAREAKFQELRTNKLYADEIVAGKITASSIDGLDSRIASLSAGNNAELSESEIETITDRIKSRIADLTGNLPDAGDLPLPAALNPDPEYIADPLVATSTAVLSSADIDFATINDYLAVIGHATITELSVTDTIYTERINSSTGVLALQNLGGSIRLAADTLIVDSTGEVAINGNLTVSGRILADSAKLNTLELGSSRDATPSGIFSVFDDSGSPVASINASGSATLAGLTTNLVSIASADSSTSGLLSSELETNSTAGEAVLVAGELDLEIHSSYVTPNSLIYLTPTANTDNKVLFIKAKNSCPELGENCQPSFVVGIDSPAQADISFNWWIIELKP